MEAVVEQCQRQQRLCGARRTDADATTRRRGMRMDAMLPRQREREFEGATSTPTLSRTVSGSCGSASVPVTEAT